jgi:hypothetical protein
MRAVQVQGKTFQPTWCESWVRIVNPVPSRHLDGATHSVATRRAARFQEAVPAEHQAHSRSESTSAFIIVRLYIAAVASTHAAVATKRYTST